MANTVCFVVLASLFIVGNGLPPPNNLKSYIGQQCGLTKRGLNTLMTQRLQDMRTRATTEVQRSCISVEEGGLRGIVNGKVSEKCNSLMMFASQPEVRNKSLAEVTPIVDSQLASNVNDADSRLKLVESQCLQ